MRPSNSRQATGKSGFKITASHSIRSPFAVITARARPPECSIEVTVWLYLNSTPCFAAAPASARGSACIPPLGKKTPFTESI
ncbi:unannotated protein [freshwater metagenome]|uniref:Unannotated protein n=1 Tax=freshwater metagenome TaxID=449393 RepID=A0A6J6UUT4_9ZZZZ